MKISCQSCQAKYTIADEKVLGKVVKIRCKKCQETIVVNGVEMSGSPSDVGGAADGEWTVNVADGDQRNLTTDAIAEAYRAGVINEETYCWRDGMEDWLPVREIDELYRAATAGGVGGGVGAQTMNMGGGMSAPMGGGGYEAPLGEPVNGHANGAAASMFGGVEGTDPYGDGPVAARRAGGRAGGDLFGSAALAGSEVEPSHTGEPPPPAAPAALTGQRNENSVLFSLAALTEQGTKPGTGGSATGAMPASSPQGSQTTATTDGSGLIDIRALSAAMTSPTGGGDTDKKANVDDIMNLGGGGAFGALSAPILAPAAIDASPLASNEPQRKGSPMLLIGLLGGGAMIAAAIIFVVVFLNKPPTGPVAGTGTAGDIARGSNSATDPTAPSAAAGSSDPVAVPIPGTTPTTTAKSPTGGAGNTAAPGTKPPTAGGNPGGTAPAVTAASQPDLPKPPDKPKTLEERMRESASGGPGAATAATPAPAGNVPFDRGAAQASLGGVNVASCKKPDGPTGSGHVVVTFGPDGSVQSAVVDAPPFSGTAVGGCVAGRYRGARVPAFSGSPVKVGKSFSIN